MMSSKFSFGKIKDLPKDSGLTHKKAVLLEKMGKLNEAIESYKLSAEDGNVKSQYTLGKIYSNRKQYHEAERWYSMAFKNGYEKAAFDLGNMYYDLEGYEYALYWYEKVAMEGNVKAENNLGVIHYKLKDYARSEKWLKIAADNNLSSACFNLGLLYLNFDRVEEAMESFKKGSVLLSDDCKYNLAILYSQNGDEKSAISM